MTTSTGTEAEAPPGWYADPAGSSAERYWDGAAWTDRLRRPERPSAGDGADGSDREAGRGEETEAPARPAAESAMTLIGEMRRGVRLLGWLLGVALAQLAVGSAALVYLAIDPSQDRGWVAALCGAGALLVAGAVGSLIRRSLR